MSIKPDLSLIHQSNISEKTMSGWEFNNSQTKIIWASPNNELICVLFIKRYNSPFWKDLEEYNNSINDPLSDVHILEIAVWDPINLDWVFEEYNCLSNVVSKFYKKFNIRSLDFQVPEETSLLGKWFVERWINSKLKSSKAKILNLNKKLEKLKEVDLENQKLMNVFKGI